MINTYKYRLYLNKKFTKILNDQIELCRQFKQGLDILKNRGSPFLNIGDRYSSKKNSF
ncbi:MAG: hypothetical protein M1481_03505 [Candidatus Thermoplasmatota archaeon]|nr:hypothetical protein [Candidatus Thermoplasmatota archaeon]MCL5964141.1 hypothetical protein [Candidatus Thermoplasmatota archaeon]